MKKLTPFDLSFSEDFSILGEYEGNEKSGKVIIFSHGFGMKRDSKGLFIQIGDLLKQNYLVVRFDYCKMLSEENATLTYSFSQQAKMLRKVVSHIKSKFKIYDVNLISHSMGCLVTGITDLENLNKVILMCSPPSKQFRSMQTYFKHKPGTIFDLEGVSKVKRSDGSWTFIHPSFWNDIKIIDPVKLIREISKKSETYFIRALQDDVIRDESYKEISSIKNVNFLELPGDHNFKGKDRKQLLKWVGEILI